MLCYINKINKNKIPHWDAGSNVFNADQPEKLLNSDKYKNTFKKKEGEWAMVSGVDVPDKKNNFALNKK